MSFPNTDSSFLLNGGMPMTMEAMHRPGYPVRYDVAYPDRLSRGLIFVKGLLAIPHFLILSGLTSVLYPISVIAAVAIFFRRRFPRGLFDMVVNVNRWSFNVGAYVGLLRDEYPPFVWGTTDYPVTFDVEYPAEMSRWLPLVKWVLAIPHYILLLVLWVVAIFAYVVAWFAILVTGRFPRGLFGFVVGITRWSTRVSMYVSLMRDEYPPFSLQ